MFLLIPDPMQTGWICVGFEAVASLPEGNDAD